MQNSVFSISRPLVMVLFSMLLVACSGMPMVPSTSATQPSQEVIDVSRSQVKLDETNSNDKSDGNQQLVDDLSSLNDLIVIASATVVDEATNAPVRISEAAQGKAPPPVRKKKTSAKSTGNAASRALLESSDKLLQQGQFRLAANNAERALRVSPRNPQAYYQLALIYQKQQQFSQAIHFAEKGLAQNGLSSSLRRKLWSLKADCYAAAGDLQSAEYARQKSSS